MVEINKPFLFRRRCSKGAADDKIIGSTNPAFSRTNPAICEKHLGGEHYYQFFNFGKIVSCNKVSNQSAELLSLYSN